MKTSSLTSSLLRAKSCAVITVGIAASLALPNAAQAQKKPNPPTGFQVTDSTSASDLLTSILGSGLT